MGANGPVLVVAGHPAETFPGAGLPVPVAVAWPTRREAIRAAVVVACFVGVPALAAVGAALALFALSAAVLLAPLVAAALTWTAWRCNRVEANPVPSPARPEADPRDGGGGLEPDGAARPTR